MTRYRSILHVDMDAFFASVEQREHPEFKGKPVVVGSDPQEGRGRGVVAACSYEARRFGIHSAQPISQAYRLCPNAIFVRPRGQLYREVSERIMSLLGDFSDRVEPISVDEAFLDVTGEERLLGTAEQIARRIKAEVLARERITCSVGVATTKFVAKIASDFQKPDGLTVVAPGNERDFLAPLLIRSMWGVGPKTELRLHKLGVRRIGDLARRSEAFWARQLGKSGSHFWRLSQGIDPRDVLNHSGFKSLSHEITFDEDTLDADRVRETLLSLSHAVASRVRKHNQAGRRIILKWRHADFTTRTRQRALRESTADDQRVFLVAWDLAQEFFPLRQAVRLLGVGMADFTEVESKPQGGLFDQPGDNSSLNASLDRITAKFGKGAIKRARLIDRDDDNDERISTFREN